MRQRVQTGFAVCLGLALAWVLGAAPAAAVDCNARWLGETEAAICQDAQLSRTDEQTARRVASLARRLAFGQYLGLRHWHTRWAEHRDGCQAGPRLPDGQLPGAGAFSRPAAAVPRQRPAAPRLPAQHAQHRARGGAAVTQTGSDPLLNRGSPHVGQGV